MIFSFCALTQLACKKDGVNPGHRGNIYGHWQWVNSTGGFTGKDTINPPPRSAVFVDFRNDMTYATTIEAQIISQGTFEISTVDNVRILHLKNFVKTSGLWFEVNGEIIQIDNNNLHLTDYQISEPYTHNFER